MEVEEKPKKHGTSKRKRMKAVQAKIREQVKKLYILGVCVGGGGDLVTVRLVEAEY